MPNSTPNARAFRTAILFSLFWLVLCFFVAKYLDFLQARRLAYLASVAAFGFTLTLIGQAGSNRRLGLLIDEHYRVSLSRFQACLWTLVVVPALTVTVMWNLARGSTPTAYPPGAHDYPRAFDLTIPTRLWELLGLSVTSLVGASVAKSQKDLMVRRMQAGERTGDGGLVPDGCSEGRVWCYSYRGNIAQHDEVGQAGLGDLFYAETIASDYPTGGPPYLDLNRAQQLFISMVTVVAYGMIILKMLYGNAWIDAFPNFSEGAVAILAISHASYLTGKFVSDPVRPVKSQELG